jgi:prepilin-type processing-associated H-X9-DG protein
VAVSPDLAQKYLDGYAKNRSGWPLTADLTRAASGHTAFAVVNVQKVPREALNQVGGNDQFSALAATQKVTVTANLRGKELSLGVRASYPDAASAGKAKDQAQALLDMASGFIGMAAGGKEMAEMAALKPAVTEAQRAVKAAKLEVAGSDLTLAASYKADFDIGPMVTEVVKKIRDTGVRMTVQNNLKQIGLGLHSYNDATGKLPIHGVGAKGAVLTRPTDKPLLSWRVAILPYIEQDDLYKQFKLDEPWDGPNNKKLIDKMPKVFAPEKPGKPGHTHLQMIVGPNAMPLTGLAIQQIPDGSSNTIAVAEAAEPVIWTKPDDIMLPAKLAPGELKKKFGGPTPGGFNVVMWDGSVRFVRNTVNERSLALALNPRDGMPLPFDWTEK